MKTILILSALAVLSACGMQGSTMAQNECTGHLGLTKGTSEFNDCVARIDDNTTAMRKTAN